MSFLMNKKMNSHIKITKSYDHDLVNVYRCYCAYLQYKHC